MALPTSRKLVVRGAPARTGGGNNGSKRAHWASLRSLGYGLRCLVSIGSTPGLRRRSKVVVDPNRQVMSRRSRFPRPF